MCWAWLGRGASWGKFLALLSVLTCGGCEVLGVAANTVSGTSKVAAAYPGLKGQQVAIMVWADPAIVMDHPEISADVVLSLRNKLREAQDAGVDELKQTRFEPVDPVLRFQDAHPELQTDSASQIALMLPQPLTRLVYIEVGSFTIHPSESPDLSRGDVVAGVKVIEVSAGKTKVAYEADNITGVYPSDAPPEGLPNLDDQTVYHKSIDDLTTNLAKLFISYHSDTQ